MLMENNFKAPLNQIFTIDAPEPAFVASSADLSDARVSFEGLSLSKKSGAGQIR